MRSRRAGLAAPALIVAAFVVAALAPACGTEGGTGGRARDVRDAIPPDAGSNDANASGDAATASDDVRTIDAGASDAAAILDAAILDAAILDATVRDTAVDDVGTADAAARDAEAPETAQPDAGAPDTHAGAPDTHAGPFADGFAYPPCEPQVDAVTVSGFVYVFGPGSFTPGAPVVALEDPALATALDARGRFTLEGVPPCTELTLRLEDPALQPVQSGTLFVANEPVEDVDFQTPTPTVFGLFLRMAGVTEPDPTRCQVVTTVTRGGDAWHQAVHGLAGATATLEPPPAAGQGPVYFAFQDTSLVYPDPRLAETTQDGGVGFLDVPPGNYVIHGHREGVAFTSPRVKCRAGWFVNAAPPYGVTERLAPDAR